MEEYVRSLHGVFEMSWYDADIAVVKLLGEHDLSTKDELEAALSKLVLGSELVVVDLTDAEFIDSSVLNALLGAERLARTRGLRVALQLPQSSAVSRVLEHAGLLDHFPCAETRRDAASLARLSGYIAGGDPPSAA
jgi:anti-sigma B factor antagonist